MKDVCPGETVVGVLVGLRPPIQPKPSTMANMIIMNKGEEPWPVAAA